MKTKLQLQAGLVVEAVLLLLVIGQGRLANVQAGSIPPATQTYYRFTTIDISGSTFIAPDGINDDRLVSGFFIDAAGSYHGFLWRTGAVITIDAPGWASTAPGGCNNQGVVAGSYDDSIVSHAGLFNVNARTWSALPDIPNKPVNWGFAINNQGVVVGAAMEGSAAGSLSNAVAWIWDGSAYSLFTVPGVSASRGSWATGINDRGQICGYCQDSQGVRHGFLKEGAAMSTFDVPGADGGIGQVAINNLGDVVGPCNAAGVFHGFLMHAGAFLTLDVPGATDTGIYANNNQGDLVGAYADSSGHWHGFVATPERLSIANTGTNVLISWPVAAVTFQLQSTPSLSNSISWSAASQAAATNGSTVSVLVPASPDAAYFRLRRVP